MYKRKSSLNSPFGQQCYVDAVAIATAVPSGDGRLRSIGVSLVIVWTQ